MIGHKVNDKLQTGTMGALYQVLKFLHSVGHTGSQVGVYIIIVLDGIRTTGLAFYHGRMVFLYAEGSIVRLCGVLNQTGIPDMCGTK